ncbi:amidohydrolase family protein [Rhodothermus profundi]|uniref:Imidazolonepropionase n=1 Tax=Rhodothermus profundi TaxID=633813 RepID=A0A1M6UEU6_9BACT|nr:amidohydrolase family protein [Rhodothermus profundi]SHK67697.1 Imidazolonepropionase [Rhodothermus profundi]
MRWLWSFVCLVLAGSLYAQERPVALIGAHVVNPAGFPSYPEATVLLEGSRIVAVGPADQITVPPEAERIDLRGKWIIPGLIDAHVHFFQSGGLYTRPDVIDRRHVVPYEEELAQIRQRLPDTFARYLRCGITGVVDVGGPFWNFDVRRQAQQTLRAPRVAVAGPLISTYQPAALTTDDPPIIKVTTPEEARALVQRELAHQPDLIKIWYIVRPGETPAQHLPVVQAAIEEAHAHGVRVAVHATQLETARLAVQAGADILVHSVTDQEVDDAFIRLLREHQVLYTPTLVVWEGYLEVLSRQVQLSLPELTWANPYVVATLFDLYADTTYRPPSARWVEARRRRLRIAQRNLKRLQEGGVRIAAGTDAGNIGTLHGPAIFREFELMAEAGLTPHQILTSATLHGAMVLGMADKLGVIEPGRLADLVVLDADPRLDVQHFRAIHLIIKDGQAFRPASLIQETAVDLVQRQLNAYNARHLEAFLATYAPDVAVYDFPGTLRMQGLEALRARYGRLFEENPRLHARLLGRLTVGAFVIDREQVVGRADGRILHAIAIYEVRDGRIQRVWFIRGN